MCAPSTMTCGLVGGAVALMNCGASARAATSAGRVAMWRIKHTAAAKPAYKHSALQPTLVHERAASWPCHAVQNLCMFRYVMCMRYASC